MKKLIGIIAIAVISYFGIAAVNNKNKTDVSLPKYQEFRVRVADLDNFVEADGVVEAKSTRKIFVDKALKVKDLYFEEGDFIKNGDLIMTFDDEEKNRLLRSIEKEEIELKKLERDLRNAKELYDLGGSTLVTIEDLGLEIRKKNLNLEEYREELDKTISEIRSPFEGTILSMIAEENYRVNTEVELFELADLSEVVIKAQVPEYDIINVQLGQEVRIKPEVFEKQEVLTGRVVKIANLSTEVQGANEAYVEVDIEVDGIGQNLLPGFTSDLEIVYQKKDNTIMVPRTAIVGKEGSLYVFVADEDGVVTKVEVETGISNKNSIEVLSGLDNGDRLVANPDKNLEDGNKVELTFARGAKSGSRDDKSSNPMRGMR